jgi:hypothetical protein
MDLSVGIAIGSSLQIALFVAPLLLFVSYLFGKPMDLEFSRPEVFAVVASVYILFQISGDGESNWIEGRPASLRLPHPWDFIFLSGRSCFALAVSTTFEPSSITRNIASPGMGALLSIT